MRKPCVLWMALAMLAVLAASSAALPAAELPLANLALLLKGTPVDVPCPGSCEQCKKEFCIERVPVKKCVKGKKKVYDCKVRYQYVSIPETRYRWVNKCITKDIPACYCKPVCKTKEGSRSYQSEKWEKEGFQTCSGCGGLYCKYCENKTEKAPCKYCDSKPGKTTIRVCYKSCIKQPYTVYRRVKQPVCVKKPRYERVRVSITNYKCRHCNGGGCDNCGDPDCDASSCEYAGEWGGEDFSSEMPPLPPETSVGL